MTGSGSADLTETPPALEPEPTPLPETRRSGRARQRRHQRRLRRRRILSLVVAVTGLAASVALLVTAPDSGDPDRPGRGGPSSTVAPQALQPLLLAQQDAAGRAVSLTVLAPAARGPGGNLVLIPPGTMTEVVSLGLEPVGRSLDLGGPGRLQATVENLLGVALADVVVVDDEAISALLAPLGPLTVRVPNRVEQVDGNGRVEVLYEAGLARLAPGEAGRFLAVKGNGGNDLTRLARHQGFWEAWMAALRAQPALVPAQPPALARALSTLSRGEVRTRVLPVEAFGAAGEDGELYKVRDAEMHRMVESAFPAGAQRGPVERPRVQILNGTGAIGLADAVRDKLGPAFDVRLTGNAGTLDHAQTEVVFYRREKQPVAERVRRALGVGNLVLSRRPLDVVDVTIVVGKDFTAE